MDKIGNKEFKNYYKILNISPDADLKEITAAYNKIFEKLNLDSAILGGFTGHLKYQKDLYNRAFSTLKSPEARKEFDQRLKEHEDESANDFSKKLLNYLEEEKARDREVMKNKAKTLFITAKNLLNQKKNDEAIKAFKELINLDQKNAIYHSYLGMALKNKGWDNYAQAEFKIALNYDKNEPLALKYINNQAKRNVPEKNGLLSRIINISRRLFRRNLQKI